MRIDLYMTALEIETPFGNRAEVHGKTVEGQKHIRFEPALLSFQILHHDRR